MAKSKKAKKPKAPPSPNSFRCRFNRFMERIDFAAHLAERIEPNFKTWWVPATLLAFPVLLLVLAAIITNFRPG